MLKFAVARGQRSPVQSCRSHRLPTHLAFGIVHKATQLICGGSLGP
jgi:hypothetical protein